MESTAWSKIVPKLEISLLRKAAYLFLIFWKFPLKEKRSRLMDDLWSYYTRPDGLFVVWDDRTTANVDLCKQTRSIINNVLLFSRVKIYSIIINNTIDGGAEHCRECPVTSSEKGYASLQNCILNHLYRYIASPNTSSKVTTSGVLWNLLRHIQFEKPYLENMWLIFFCPMGFSIFVRRCVQKCTYLDKKQFWLESRSVFLALLPNFASGNTDNLQFTPQALLIKLR